MGGFDEHHSADTVYGNGVAGPSRREEDLNGKTFLPHVTKAYDIFMRFVEVNEDGSVDTSGFLSEECYMWWLKTRSKPLKNPSRSFKDAIKTIVAGTNRCLPFPPEIEASILVHLRQRKVWKCFEKVPGVDIGKRGWNIKGFHEKVREEKRNAKSSTTKELPSTENDKNISSRKNETCHKPGPDGFFELEGEDITKEPELERGPGKSVGEISTDCSSPSGQEEPDSNQSIVEVPAQYPCRAGKRHSIRDFSDFVEELVKSTSGTEKTYLLNSDDAVLPILLDLKDNEDENSEIEIGNLKEAYNVFETLCNNPPAGYEHHYETLQILLDPDVSEKLRKRVEECDPRLDMYFLAPRNCEFHPGIEKLLVFCEYKFDGTPYRVIERDDAVVDLFGYDPLGKEIPCSACPLHDAWIVYCHEKSGCNERVAKGEAVWMHNFFETGSGTKIVRMLLQFVGLTEEGSGRVKIIGQDVSSLYTEMLKLPPLF